MAERKLSSSGPAGHKGLRALAMKAASMVRAISGKGK